MTDEPPGGGPPSRDPHQLVRQLRRAMREQPLTARPRRGATGDEHAAETSEDERPVEPSGPTGPPTSAEPPTPTESTPAEPRTSAEQPAPALPGDLAPPAHGHDGPSLFDTPGAGILAIPAEVPLAAEPVAPRPTDTPDHATDPRPRGRPGRRGVAVVAALVLLVAAVPLLTWYGFHLVFATRGGHAVNTVSDPSAPGYLALITPTPTVLVIQVDDTNQAVSLTLLSLTMQDKGGGTVVFIPLDTALPVPGYGIDRLRTAYVRGGATALASAASQVLQIGFSQVVTVDPDKLTSLVQPVSPVPVDNPDSVHTATDSFPQGSIQLSADQVAGYLTATMPGESDLERLNRQGQFWTGWLAAVGHSNSADVVPGEANTGLGHFVRTLAAGPVTYETLPVNADTTSLPDGTQVFQADEGAVGKLIALGVPYPVGNGDQRATVRLLDGANGKGIPPGIVQSIVLGGGQISEIGNARKFGATTTEIHYTDPARKGAVDRLQYALGGKAKEVLDDTGEDTVQVTIVLGSDLIDHPPAPLLSGPLTSG